MTTTEPRPIRIRARSRRDHVVPVRYLDKGTWHDLTSAGPDRISGGHEEARPYAREYFRCVSDSGAQPSRISFDTACAVTGVSNMPLR